MRASDSEQILLLKTSLSRKFIQLVKAEGLSEAHAYVANLLQPGDEAVAWGEGWLETPPAGWTGAWTYLTDGPPPAGLRTKLAGTRVAVTGAEALVASSGTVVLAEEWGIGRAASSLAELHIVIASAEQVLPDLAAATALIRQRHGGGVPRYVSLITGPSRSGDIEFKVARGVHGPREVHVVLLERSPAKVV